MTRARLVLALAATVVVPAIAGAAGPGTSPAAGIQQQSTPPAQEKPAAEPASIAGKWSLSTQSPQGTMVSTLDIKLDGKKVTGTITSEMGTAPVAGEFADGKLEFTITMDANGSSFEIWFGGAVKEDGTMAGTLDFGQGEMPWTAKRVK